MGASSPFASSEALTINYQRSTLNRSRAGTLALLTINYQLSTIDYQLSTLNSQLSTIEEERVYKIADLKHGWLVKPAPTSQRSTVNYRGEGGFIRLPILSTDGW